MKYSIWICLAGIILISCQRQVHLPKPAVKQSITGTGFFKKVLLLTQPDREVLAEEYILSGGSPDFMRKLIPIHTSIVTAEGKKITATYFVTRDYLSVGTNADFMRIPLTPYTAQRIADSLHCFLPTRKMIDDIYAASTVKLEPVPMYAFRDSIVTMYQHNLIIEGQRKGANGLIAGIKKDVVLTSRIPKQAPRNVAIYGWHMPGGKPIQPLYVGHIASYVDYSHGIRLAYRTVWVNGKPMDYKEIMNNPALRNLLCDEEDCSHVRYTSPTKADSAHFNSF